MEDIDDNLPTNGKRYYMSHSEYFRKDKYWTDLGLPIPSTPYAISMLVCASNIENAKKAVENTIGKDKIIIMCRIDYLVVGD